MSADWVWSFVGVSLLVGLVVGYLIGHVLGYAQGWDDGRQYGWRECGTVPEALRY